MDANGTSGKGGEMIDIYGTPESIEWLEKLFETAIGLRLGGVEKEKRNGKNGHNKEELDVIREEDKEGQEAGQGTEQGAEQGAELDIELRKYCTTNDRIPQIRYRVWIDNREGDGRDSRVRLGEADAKKMIELLREPRSMCRGNRWHKPCRHAHFYALGGIDCGMMNRNVDVRRCGDYEPVQGSVEQKTEKKER